jgi:glycerophosphoryl diester phosphodiesterase
MNGLSIPETMRNAARTFRLCLPDLFAFWIILAVLFSVVLGPLTGWVLNRLFVQRGALHLSNEQVLAFVGTPTGVLALLLIGTLMFASLFTQQAGMIIIASRAIEGRRTKPFTAFRLIIKQLTRLFELGFAQLLLYCLALVPFLLIGGGVYFGLLSEHDINFYLARKPTEFWIAAVLAVVLLLGLVSSIAFLFVRWSLSLPCLLIDAKRGFAALKESRRLVGGSFLMVASLILGWSLFLVILGGAVAFVVHGLGEYFLQGVEGFQFAITVVASVLTLDFLTTAALSFVGLAGAGLLVTHLFYALGTAKGLSHRKQALQDPERGRTHLRWVPWLVAIPAFVIAMVGTVSLIDEDLLSDNVQVTAHRGSSRRAPENTLSAVRAAIEDGADYAEIDVQETADGVVVVLHDSDLMRMTGVNKKIWEIEYAELKELDVGSWFSEEFKGEKVPTLGEVVALAGDEIMLNIELKFNGHDQKLVERTVEIIRESDFEARCVVTSLDSQGILQAKRQHPALEVGYILYQVVGDISNMDVDFFSVNRSLVNRGFIASVHSREKDVHVWTVNTREDMTLMLDMGVDNIITDEPALLVSLLEERAELSELERFLLKVRALLLQ